MKVYDQIIKSIKTNIMLLDGWVGVKAILRIAYSNQKHKRP